MTPAGFVIFVIVVAAVVALIAVTVSRPRGTSPGGRVCAGCGMAQPHHARYCRKCGRSL